jgi:hypothetical protein
VDLDDPAEWPVEVGIPRILLGVIVRAAKDAKGNLLDVPRDKARDVMEDARRFLHSKDAEVYAFSVGFSARSFREYLSLVPQPKEATDARA